MIDGKKIAEDVRREVAARVVRMKQETGKVPGLAVVLVGSRKDSETYVRNKKKACSEARPFLPPPRPLRARTHRAPSPGKKLATSPQSL